MTFTATYRLQLHDDFGFADAAAIVPYLARLGVSHLYLSPILQAVAGSMHGYDVVDHTQISRGLGGRSGFEALAATAREHGLGIIVDVVPNHMAFVAPESANLPLWLVLRDGRDAITADWFDIDWKAGGGRLGLPVLGDTLEAVLQAGELVVDEIEDPVRGHSADTSHTPTGYVEPDTARAQLEPSGVLVLRYHEHVYPIALGTEGDARPGDNDAATVRAVLDRQHYRLTSWREKDDALNYRRFFEVDGLIAVRVELPEVFAATHELLLELNAEGLIDGFRIDHPDGLADPAGYLEQLHRATKRGTLVWVEKILEGSEELPTDWKCAGTTGYDAMRAIQAALVDTADADVITATWRAAGGQTDIDEAVAQAKRQVVAQSLVPEVERLTRRAREAAPQLDPERLRAAVVELLVAGEVYRAYIRPDDSRISDDARHRLVEAFSAALGQRPDLETELRALVPMTVGEGTDDPAISDFSVRLQQTWGPVMAKGIEDTTFYRWHRLVALNDVGGDPSDLDRALSGPDSGIALLHAWAQRQQADWPEGMTTLSTHDTKRSEDVRARIIAVAGDPTAWEACSHAALAAAKSADIDAPTAHLVWQTILGVGHISAQRLEDYLLKALREAKQHTAWVDGDADYEARVVEFARSLRDPGPVHESIEAAVTANAEAIRATTLAAKALCLTLPGLPDTYQGCEIVDLSLVDPDNRRPVDYALRQKLLADVDAESAAATDGGDSAATLLGQQAAELGASPLDVEKLRLTTAILTLRRESPELFSGGSSYTPLLGDEDHVLGFVRTSAVGLLAGVFGIGREGAVATLVTRAPARLQASGGWGEREVELPEGTWRDIVSGAIREGGSVRCADVFADSPVAVLLRE